MRRFMADRAVRAVAALAGAGAACSPILTCDTPAAAAAPPRPAAIAPVLAPQLTRAFGSAIGPSVFPGHLSAAPATRVAAVDRPVRLTARMIAAGNRIARLPYVYGGGHGSFRDSGYDCSGSVSYVLHAAGLLATPEASGDLESFGLPGPGRHVTVYANGGHAWMTIDGRRFDTNALAETGTRWSSTISPSDGYVVRHPAGL